MPLISGQAAGELGCKNWDLIRYTGVKAHGDAGNRQGRGC